MQKILLLLLLLLNPVKIVMRNQLAMIKQKVQLTIKVATLLVQKRYTKLRWYKICYKINISDNGDLMGFPEEKHSQPAQIYATFHHAHIPLYKIHVIKISMTSERSWECGKLGKQILNALAPWLLNFFLNKICKEFETILHKDR